MRKVLAGLAATGTLFAAAAPASASGSYLSRAQAVQSVRISSQRWLGETPVRIRCHRHSAREFYCRIVTRGPVSLDRTKCSPGCTIITVMRGVDVLQRGRFVLVRPLRHRWTVAIRIDYPATRAGHGLATGRG